MQREPANYAAGHTAFLSPANSCGGFESLQSDEPSAELVSSALEVSPPLSSLVLAHETGDHQSWAKKNNSCTSRGQQHREISEAFFFFFFNVDESLSSRMSNLCVVICRNSCLELPILAASLLAS